MRVLDLFSGIGGFALAFHQPGFKTVGYCDLSLVCQAILRSNMKRGLIDTAPVFDDVRLISKGDLVRMNPDMITAGFPCQDISILNREAKGLGGDRSGLFYEIMRIVDDCPSVKVMVFENSPQIVHRGLEHVLRELERRHFKVRNTILAASDCGAPHQRRRWFAVAVRGNFDGRPLKCTDTDWSREPVPRVHPAVHKMASVARCVTLGNAVVPMCVIFAWNLMMGVGGQEMANHVRRWRKTLSLLDGVHVTNQFPTPTCNGWRCCRVFTRRCTQLPGNVIYLEDGTYLQVKKLKKQGKIPHVPDRFHMDSVVTVNPEFVEWMMGFPLGWTKTG